jgi:hypothetical protein
MAEFDRRRLDAMKVKRHPCSYCYADGPLCPEGFVPIERCRTWQESQPSSKDRAVGAGR